jgi:hypothetical protein
VQWNRAADAMLDGNPRWLSIECADFGETFPPSSTAGDESPPLTQAQIDKIVALCTFWCDVRNHADCPSSWTCHQSGIPAEFITSSCGRGIAGHRAGIDPWRPAGCPHWSNSTGKICPRSVRLRQVRDIIVPRVQAALNPTPTPDLPEEIDMLFMFRGPDGSGLHNRAVIQGHLISFSTEEDRASLIEACEAKGVPVVLDKCSEGQYNAYVSAFSS